MKQRLLFVFASLMICLGAMADEWVHPVPVTQPISYGDTIYLYNKEAKSFFLGANSWGTRASVGPQGYKCILSETENGVQIADSAEDKGKWFYVRAKAVDDIYVDCAEGDLAYSYWTLTPKDGNDFTISTNSSGLDNMLLGVDLTSDNKTVLFLVDPAEISAENIQITWNCVSLEAYTNYQAAYEVYATAQTLNDKIAEAEELGINVDGFKAAYNNTSSSLEELNAAIEGVQAAINDFKENNASPSNPQDLTSTYIPDADFELNQGAGVWQRTHSAQNYQTSGTPGKMGDSTYFLEAWNGSNFSGKMYVPITGLPNGVYQFSLSVATNGTAATYVYAGNDSVKVTTGATMTPYTVFTKVEDGALEVGYYMPTASQGWVGIDDAKLLYLGNSKDSYAYWAKTMMESAPKYDDETLAQASLLEEYNSLIETDPYTLGSAEEVLAFYNNYTAKLNELQENVAAYAEYKNLGDQIDELSTAGYAGKEADELYDYKLDSYDDIINSKNLSTEEIIAETEKVKIMIDDVKKKCLAPGTECTNLLTNPNYDNGMTGWEYDKNYAEPAWGGLASNHDCEKWNANFDFYQIVNDVPNGVYELKVQAFYRPTGSTSESYSNYISDPNTDPILAYIYGNSTKKAICNIGAYSYNENLENNCTECTDASGNTVYVPNGMNSASNAFTQGDYENTLKFVVTDGTLKVGITSTEGTASGRWTLWDNFRLTFLGMDEEVLSALLAESKIEAEQYLDATMGKEEFDALEKAISAEPASGTEIFSAISDLDKAVTNAKASISAYEKIEDGLNQLSNAIDTFESTAPEATLEEAQVLYEKISEGLENGTYNATEANGKIEELNYMCAKLRVPNTDGASESNPIDVTCVIINNSFEDTDNVGWSWTNGGDTGIKEISNATYTVSNADGERVFNTWSGSIPETGLDVKQTILALPAGIYEVKALLASDANNIVSLAANEVSEDFTMENAKDVAQECSVKVSISEGDALTIKAYSLTTWFKADNFRLYYLGADANSITATTENSSAAPAGIYSTSGVRTSSLKKGVNIIKMTDGSVKKLYVK